MTLTTKDLNFEGLCTEASKLRTVHFKIPLKRFHEEDYVCFVDDKGLTTVLKSRRPMLDVEGANGSDN